MRAFWMAALVMAVGLAGCASQGDEGRQDEAVPDPAPVLEYVPVEPDMAMQLLMTDLYVPGTDDVTLHVRLVRPAGDGPFPTIVQDTPYTGTGCNVALTGIEPPAAGCTEGNFDRQFVRRGYAFAYADLRGTGDSTGCLNLRGQADINDIGALADALAAQPWSNGNIGFIGASYPGSTSHMAAMSGSQHVKAVVPVVASTSFYHYHHNDGVPYNGNHALGGTNAGYTQQGVTPTTNPASGAQKLAEQPLCPHVENAVMHGGADQTGDYYAWWQERNLRPGAKDITTPVLMAQGLADWNVKPDHIATWFNELGSANKTFIGGQWGHAYPRSAADPDDCPEYSPGGGGSSPCDPHIPWGDWWAYASAFFDTYLKEIDTGMFEGTLAWVQGNDGTWHRSTTFPLQGDEADGFTMHLTGGGKPRLASSPGEETTLSWHACPRDQHNMGHSVLATVEGYTVECENTQVVFESEAFDTDVRLSGVPLLNLTVDTQGRMTHIVAVLDVIDEKGGVVRGRENYGYLNTRFHAGFPQDSAVPTGFYPAALDFYPQEDLLKAGERLRLTLRSHDDGRTIEHFEEGDITVKLGAQDGAMLWFPMRPEHVTGVRLD